MLQCVKCCSTISSSSCANDEIALAVTADMPPLLGVGGGGGVGSMTWQFCAARVGSEWWGADGPDLRISGELVLFGVPLQTQWSGS